MEGPGLPAGDQVLVALVQLHNGLHDLSVHPVDLLIRGVVALLHCGQQKGGQRSKIVLQKCAVAEHPLHGHCHCLLLHAWVHSGGLIISSPSTFRIPACAGLLWKFRKTGLCTCRWLRCTSFLKLSIYPMEHWQVAYPCRITANADNLMLMRQQEASRCHVLYL